MRYNIYPNRPETSKLEVKLDVRKSPAFGTFSSGTFAAPLCNIVRVYHKCWSIKKKETKRGNSKIFVMYCEYSEDTIGSDMYMEPKYIVWTSKKKQIKI